MRICVFCGAKQGNSKAFTNEAKELGNLIGKNKHTLIYGGGNIGLMGKLARSVKTHGGKTIGILPKIFEKDCHGEDKVIKVETFEHRKAIMESKSEAFIVLAGGLGTIDEATDVLVAKQHKFHNKPLVFINTEKFFNNFLAHLDKVFKMHFADTKVKPLWYVAKNSKEAITYLESYLK